MKPSRCDRDLSFIPLLEPKKNQQSESKSKSKNTLASKENPFDWLRFNDPYTPRGAATQAASHAHAYSKNLSTPYISQVTVESQEVANRTLNRHLSCPLGRIDQIPDSFSFLQSHASPIGEEASLELACGFLEFIPLSAPGVPKRQKNKDCFSGSREKKSIRSFAQLIKLGCQDNVDLVTLLGAATYAQKKAPRPLAFVQNKKENPRITELHELLTSGLSWEGVNILPDSMDQIWRGLFLYEEISINSEKIQVLSEEDHRNYVEIKPNSFDEIPERIGLFYVDLFNCLEKEGFEFTDGKVESLKALLKHELPKEKSISRLIHLTSIGAWAFCNDLMREKFASLYVHGGTYCVIHNRRGAIEGRGVADASHCQVLITAEETRVMQIKKFRVDRQVTKQNPEKSIATFTISWDVRLPSPSEMACESYPKYTGRMVMSQFAWESNTTKKERRAFLTSFLNQASPPPYT